MTRERYLNIRNNYKLLLYAHYKEELIKRKIPLVLDGDSFIHLLCVWKDCNLIFENTQRQYDAEFNVTTHLINEQFQTIQSF